MTKLFRKLTASVALFCMLGLTAMPLVALAQDKPAADAPAAAKADDKKAAPAAAKEEKKEEAKAPATPPPTPNKGDVAWMLTSTALVLLMSVPALALFYGGLVRSKNMLSVLMQVFVTFSLITVLWCIYGYSLTFTEGAGATSPFIGGFDRLFLAGTFDPIKSEFSMAATFSKNTPIYELVYVAFQATFAAITCCLILGSIVERVKFSAVLIFMVIWFTFSYLPVAHMVWFWPGPDAYTAASVVDAQNAMGRTRLRGRHGGAHQRRRCRPGRRLRCWQTHRLRQGSDVAAQPDDDHDRRFAAVVRLVRLQRRLRAGG
jgi:Amt family ammonium transporter